MLVRETYINADQGWVFGESDVYEPWTDDTGELYRAMQKEYGRCVSSVYIDPEEGGPPIKCGWVFQGRQKYEDTGEPYLREVWVHLYEKYERRTVIEAISVNLGKHR